MHGSSAPRSDAPVRLGAHLGDGRTRFAVWTTKAARVAVELYGDDGTARSRLPLEPQGDGVYTALVAGAGEGTAYRFVLDDLVVPDPYARWLPHGVHGPAVVVSSVFPWQAARPRRRTDVIYELHVGAFTPEGTYVAAVDRLAHLADLGVDTIELMPIASFPGERGWGYDGVALYAPYAPYGTPNQLRAFIDAAHRLGMRVILDVVYNHFGPAGNYLSAYSPEYFSHEFPTPWGDAPNLRNPYLRALVVENARYWISDYRFDGLRLDALHALRDPSSTHVLDEISLAVRGEFAEAVLIGEDERNESSLVRTHGLDAVWSDDFHHQVRVALTGDQEGYYAGYRPSLADLARTIERGWLYEGQVYPPTGRSRGTAPDGLARDAFVYCLENHDQVGNRALGERLSTECGTEAFCAASMLLLFLPQRPLLFMGQEWGASSPFLYFTDHEPELGRLVSHGRREEFRKFSAFTDPAMRQRIPDPQAASTFHRSKLIWQERDTLQHARILRLYQAMLALRRSDPVLSSPDVDLSTNVSETTLTIVRGRAGERRALCWNFGSKASSHLAGWRVLLSSDADRSPGGLQPHCAALLAQP